MGHTLLLVRHDKPMDQGNRTGKELFRAAMNKLEAAEGGADDSCPYDFVTSTTEPAFANTALILATGSGDYTVTINGVATNTVTFATSDTVTCGLIAAAINDSDFADSAGKLVASSLHTAITCTSVAAGASVLVAGVRFTAQSGTVPPLGPGAFNIAGNDAADATSLALAINTHPSLQRFVMAIPVSNVVRCFARAATWFTGPNAPPNNAVSLQSSIAVSSATFAAAAFVGISCTLRGELGNWATIAVSGTNLSVANSETRLARGQGLDAVPVSSA